MKSETHPGETGDSRRLALADVRVGLKAWMRLIEGHVAVMEKDVETCPISKRRGRWIERNAAAWIAEARERYARARRTYRLALVFSGMKVRLSVLEARHVAALERLAARAAAERAKGWPLKTLYGAAPPGFAGQPPPSASRPPPPPAAVEDRPPPSR
jgi:hypothetical protein